MKFYTNSRYRRYTRGIPPDDNAIVVEDRINARLYRSSFRHHVEQLVDKNDWTRRDAAEFVRRIMWDAAFATVLKTTGARFVSYRYHPAFTPEVTNA